MNLFRPTWGNVEEGLGLVIWIRVTFSFAQGEMSDEHIYFWMFIFYSSLRIYKVTKVPHFVGYRLSAMESADQ